MMITIRLKKELTSLGTVKKADAMLEEFYTTFVSNYPNAIVNDQ